MTTRDRLCPDCGSEWTPSLKSSFCPDCGAALDGSGRRKEFETTLEASSASELPHRRREGPESTPALREVRYTLSELKRHRNPAGLERLAEAFVQTQLLFGTNVYEAACGPQLKDHAWATTSLLDDDDPKLVVPLRRVIPITDAKGKTLEEAVRDQSDKALDDGILQGGLLVTGHERVVFGWQQFRAGGWGKVGVCDACALAVSYSAVQDACADSTSVAIQTSDKCWEIILLNNLVVGNKRRPVFRERIAPYILNSLRQTTD